MRSVFAALRTLVLPYGATAGTRIVLDGINGRIRIYDAADELISEINGDGYHLFDTGDEVALLDNVGLKVTDPNGSYVWAFILDSGGAIVALQPADVAGLVFNAGQVFANSFPGQNDAPATHVYSPYIDPGGSPSSIILVGSDTAANAPTIDHRAPGGRHRFLTGDVQAYGHVIDEDGIGFPVCQQGTEVMEVAAPAATEAVAVVFPTPFDTVPKVMTNINGNSGLYARWGSRAVNVTTTGFTLFIFAVNPSTNANNFNVDVDWVATAIS